MTRLSFRYKERPGVAGLTSRTPGSRAALIFRCHGRGRVSKSKIFAPIAEPGPINGLAGAEILCKSPPVSAIGAKPPLLAVAAYFRFPPGGAVCGRRKAPYSNLERIPAR